MARHAVLFSLLYASEGAPIGFIWWALPTLLRSADVAIDRITALSALLLLPWVFKFLWAPLLDVLRGPRWGYRAWLVLTQTVMGAALVPLIWLDPVAEFESWRLLLLVHALAAATQDVAIDALAIGAVPAAERGRLNGAMQAGMLVGRSAFGGGALLVGALTGRGVVMAALVAWIALMLIAARLLNPVEPPRDDTRSLRGTALDVVRQPTTWIGLVFAVVAAAGFEATGQLAGPYLVDRGVSNEAIGLFFGGLVVASMLVGGLAGGLLADRLERSRVASLGLTGFVTAIFLLAFADLSGATSPPVLMGLLTVMYFFVGQFTAATYAIFMDLTHPRVAATQFSAFMAGTNACESWSTWSSGLIVTRHGYPAAFVAMSAMSLLGLPLLRQIRRVGRTAT